MDGGDEEVLDSQLLAPILRLKESLGLSDIKSNQFEAPQPGGSRTPRASIPSLPCYQRAAWSTAGIQKTCSWRERFSFLGDCDPAELHCEGTKLYLYHPLHYKNLLPRSKHPSDKGKRGVS